MTGLAHRPRAQSRQALTLGWVGLSMATLGWAPSPAIEPVAPAARAGVLALAQTVDLPKPSLRPTSLAILVLSEAASGYPISEVYGATRRPLEENTALRVAPLEAIGIDERDAVIRACAGDAACFVRRLQATRGEVDLLLAVSVDRPGEDLLLGLRLIDTRSQEQIGATGAEIPAGMALEGAVERLLPDVVPVTVWGQVAGVQISSDPSSAEATVSGRSCVTPCTFERLAPGTYTVEVRTGGREPWRSEVELVSGRTANIVAELEAPDSSLLESPWLWTAVGLGVAGGIVGAFLLAQEPEREMILCFSARDGVCEGL